MSGWGEGGVRCVEGVDEGDVWVGGKRGFWGVGGERVGRIGSRFMRMRK